MRNELTPKRRSPTSRLPAKRSRPEMAPQRLEKIESAPENGMGWEISNLQDLVHGGAADGGSTGVTKVQKKAPKALKSLDAGLKSAPVLVGTCRASSIRRA